MDSIVVRAGYLLAATLMGYWIYGWTGAAAAFVGLNVAALLLRG